MSPPAQTRAGPRVRATRTLAASLVVVAGGVVWWPFAKHMVFKFSDFWFHLDRAERMAATGRILEPHFLFHGVVIALATLLPGVTFETAGYLTLVGALTGSVVAAYLVLSSDVPPMPAWRHAALLVPLSYAVMLAGPVHALATDGTRTLGYVVPNTYHNPTLLVLKPIALVLFWLVTTERAAPRSALGTAASLGVVTVLSALAKPHFLLCLVPAVVVLAIRDRWTGAPIRWPIVVGLVVPALAVLAWQYRMAEGMRLGSGIEWAPLKVMGYFSTHLAEKLARSILFPVAVLCGVPAARSDRRLGLAWTAFAFGCLQTYGLAEGGEGFVNGNFVWSAQVTCAVLYVASAKALLDATLAPRRGGERAGLAVAWAVFAAHVGSGLGSYRLHFTETPFD